MNRFTELMSLMLTELALVSPPLPERQFLLDRGWVPLGANCSTGLEGWGKMINHKAVMVDQPEALKIEGWKGEVGRGTL